MTEHRIISLIASATEIVSALGCEQQLVGCSHECDYPESVLNLPACSEAKLNVHGSSREIDERVKSILQDAVSVYRVFEDQLEALQPTVIITQTQCEVCAVSLKDVEQAVCQLTSSDPEIVSCEPMELADVWRDIQRIADALGISESAIRLISELKKRLSQIETITQQLEHRPTIACIEWIDPLMSAGNWVPQLIEIAGGTNLFGEAGQHSPWMTFEELCAANPDIIAIMPCGFDINRARVELPVLTQLPEWLQLKAVQQRNVFVTDGNQYFNRPGPRLVESAEILAELLHPELFPARHQATGWQRL